MTEYIERDMVIDDIGDLFTICYETLPNEYGHHFIVEKELQTHLDFVRKLPAADVVEVVRCKDCKHFEQAECPWDELFVINVNDYCSRGERKGGE